MGKDVKKQMECLKDVNWKDEIGGLMSKLRPWALKVGRFAARPLLQFYYVLEDENTSTRERVMIYAAIIYTILPTDLIPSAVFKFLGILDDGVAMLYVYKKIKNKITPAINAKVEDTFKEWFGIEYEVIE